MLTRHFTTVAQHIPNRPATTWPPRPLPPSIHLWGWWLVENVVISEGPAAPSVRQPFLTSAHMSKCLRMRLNGAQLKDVCLRAELEAPFGGLGIFLCPCVSVCSVNLLAPPHSRDAAVAAWSSFSPRSNFLFKISPGSGIVFALLF